MPWAAKRSLGSKYSSMRYPAQTKKGTLNVAAVDTLHLRTSDSGSECSVEGSGLLALAFYVMDSGLASATFCLKGAGPLLSCSSKLLAGQVFSMTQVSPLRQIFLQTA